jgi:hypothetical protein
MVDTSSAPCRGGLEYLHRQYHSTGSVSKMSESAQAIICRFKKTRACTSHACCVEQALHVRTEASAAAQQQYDSQRLLPVTRVTPSIACRGVPGWAQAPGSLTKQSAPRVAAVTHMGRAISFIWLSTLPASAASSHTKEKQPTRWPYLQSRTQNYWSALMQTFTAALQCIWRVHQALVSHTTRAHCLY